MSIKVKKIFNVFKVSLKLKMQHFRKGDCVEKKFFVLKFFFSKKLKT